MQSATGDLSYRKINQETLPIALDIWHQTWPSEGPDADYIAKPLDPDDESNVTWLVYHGDDLIGITGVYAYDPDESGYDDGASIWMDWFAILPEFRRRHFGEQVLLDTIAYCRQLHKYHYFRLDTTYTPDKPALYLYDKFLPLREEYTAEDTATKRQNYLIYSYSLDGTPLKPWNNQLLDIGDNPKI